MGIAKTYVLETIVHQPSICCRLCGQRSFNENDILNRYCAYCRRFHEAPLFVFFTDSPDAGSPDAGSPDCLCSLCRKSIGEEEVPIRMIGGEPVVEARFHQACAAVLSRQTTVSWSQHGKEKK